MEIVWYKDANEMPRELMSSFINRQIECWWSEPFDEYLICRDCWMLNSIQKVHWSVENFRTKTIDEIDYKCECWGKTRLFYPKDEFVQIAEEYFKGQVSLILLLEWENVEWFWIISRATLQDLFELEFNTRPNSYDKNKAIKQISNHIFWVDDAREELLVCLHHIFVSESKREWNVLYEMLKKLFLLNPEYRDLPVIWETKYESKFYSISRTIWFENILNADHWYVMQSISSYSKIIDFLISHNSLKDGGIFRSLLKHRKEALKLLSTLWVTSWTIYT